MIRLPLFVIGYTSIRSCRSGSGIANAGTGAPTSLQNEFSAQLKSRLIVHRTS